METITPIFIKSEGYLKALSNAQPLPEIYVPTTDPVINSPVETIQPSSISHANNNFWKYVGIGCCVFAVAAGVDYYFKMRRLKKENETKSKANNVINSQTVTLPSNEIKINSEVSSYNMY